MREVVAALIISLAALTSAIAKRNWLVTRFGKVLAQRSTEQSTPDTLAFEWHTGVLDGMVVSGSLLSFR
jgi:hypothetical protein